MDTFWSTSVQETEELYASQALRFREDNKDPWLDVLGVRDGMDVLEDGCAGGAFCHRIKCSPPGTRITGLDRDSGHIAYARKKSMQLGLDCAFVEGDMEVTPYCPSGGPKKIVDANRIYRLLETKIAGKPTKNAKKPVFPSSIFIALLVYLYISTHNTPLTGIPSPVDVLCRLMTVF